MRRSACFIVTCCSDRPGWQPGRQAAVLRAGGCPDFGPNNDVEQVIRIMHFCHVGSGSPSSHVDMMGRHGPWRTCFGAC